MITMILPAQRRILHEQHKVPLEAVDNAHGLE